jgi:hypothetical protein
VKLENGYRVAKKPGDKDMTILLIVDGIIRGEFEPDPTQPALAAGLYDFDLNLIGTEGPDGEIIPVTSDAKAH